jgi:hypothetical protein
MKVAVCPHLIRDISATTYTRKAADLIGPAGRLSDNAENVFKGDYLLDALFDSRLRNTPAIFNSRLR